MIKSLKGAHTILFSSHILSEVQSLYDELIIIDQGKVIEQGPYDQIIAKYDNGASYELQVRQGASALAEKISKIDGINVEGNSADRSVQFSTSIDSDSIDLVAKEVLDGGHGLIQLTQKVGKLRGRLQINSLGAK